MKIPTSYRQITVEQLIKLGKIDKGLSKIERDVAILSILTGQPEEYFDSLSWDELTKLVREIRFLDENKLPAKIKKVIWLNKTRYVAHTHPGSYSTDVYLSIKLYQKDTLNNIHKILAWMYKPSFAKHDPEKSANDFLKASVADVYGAFFLLSQVLLNWKAITEYSIMESSEILTNHMKEVRETLLQSTGDGMTHLTQLLSQPKA